METPIVQYTDQSSTVSKPFKAQNIPRGKIKINLLNQISSSSNTSTNNIVVINNFINKREFVRRPSKKRNSKSSSHTRERKISFEHTKESTMPNKRCDINGNEIKKKGKHKISFIDKMSKKRLVDVEEIESFKEYNIVEDIGSDGHHQGCCIVY